VLAPATALLQFGRQLQPQLFVLTPATALLEPRPRPWPQLLLSMEARWFVSPHLRPSKAFVLLFVSATVLVSEADATEALLHLQGIFYQLPKKVCFILCQSSKKGFRTGLNPLAAKKFYTPSALKIFRQILAWPLKTAF
jgi:hypothetical protein